MGPAAASTANVRNLGAIIDTTNFSISLGQALVHSAIAGDSSTDGGLTKRGSGTLTLNGVNTYNGPTTISGGTLALSGGGSIANSSSINVSAGTTFDVSAAVSYAVGALQALKGSGTVNGLATINGTLAPGTSGGIGTLTFSAPPVLNGTTVMELNRGSAPNSDGLVINSGTLNCGGVLTVANIGPAVKAGDSFQLFQAGNITGSFASVNLPALDANLVWNTNDLSRGWLSVAQTVATNPTNLTWSVSGADLALSWPVDHTGWRLQVQTNSLTTGLGETWFDVPGSAVTNSLILPMDLNNESVFYRLISP
jgi:autotransporter-associated beta strand protein